ncbi:hypothetical protein HDR66_03795 [bacterium]|nr:hypothetical protein [bacterium]
MSEKTNVRRLFLFAAYDAVGHVDASLVYYVRALSGFGDVVVHMDNDCADNSIDKLKPFTIHAAAARHGEYDFGSYKRAYIWACENRNLADYDYVYMVNDSVYGPLYDLTDTITELEQSCNDAFGMVCNPNRNHPHIQSWFIGMRPSVFLSNWFDEFIRSVKKLSGKGLITQVYEHGFSAAVVRDGGRWTCKWRVHNRGIYNQVKSLYRRKMPFMKKVAFSRHNGRLGRQILYVLNHIPTDGRDAILENARRTWGAAYVENLLTRNPFKIMSRTIRYFISKTKNKKK